MSLIIDPLSVATNGFQESGVVGGVPPGPVQGVPRDQMRCATHGWIIIDFDTIPEPGTVICVDFLSNGLTDCIVPPNEVDAVIEDNETAAEVASTHTDVEVESEATIAEVSPGPTDIDVMVAGTGAKVEGKTAANVSNPSAGANVDGSPTTADVEPSDTDFDPQDQC